MNQAVATRILAKLGHSVVVAGDGREALEVLDHESFDLVLMDVQMPEMDGFEATAAIRAREQGTGAHMPIVAMTARAMSGDREKCISSGMDDYASKPIILTELSAAIGRVMTNQPQPHVRLSDITIWSPDQYNSLFLIVDSGSVKFRRASGCCRL